MNIEMNKQILELTPQKHCEITVNSDPLIDRISFGHMKLTNTKSRRKQKNLNRPKNW
jgi:hypothetical protein